ncbi:ribosome small subunit-dependent GTPase A [Phocicoccus pinnipedialis]|uniref:Small ribosomal subunit biogenesis GTPase RsgA n=1 Tax=Phocicoccus pinnipedialis TaxID=110845 RepID=A0A6V7RHV6_9BACL|nr:ribosome small subunit-dependent GTPase A [Jeotgalicoccus pinnipedialis]MBP1939073.1 ribosome biogenesis GTPase [Jeotgalicoccus pinnipedialis]CAD2076917.1 Putative ribosome biogenesis GTPase RsgA [Jeotgalicoccus pinnipedialis]
MRTGRLVKALSGFYYIKVDEEIYQTRARGIFRKSGMYSPLVGDIVDFESDNLKEGTLINIHERKNALNRPQVANVDQILITMSLKSPDFSFYLTDRFIAYSESFDIEPVLIVTKKDLNIDDNLIDKIKETYKMYKIFFTSKEHFDKDLGDIFTNKLSVLAGQTGVGKSTLLNTLLPELDLETGEVSKALGRGRHTTRHVELIEKNGGLVADTPGFSIIEFTHIDKETLKYCFVDFDTPSESCRFRGCNHINEPKCGVKNAVESGDIKQWRYDSYLQIYEEIENYKERY